MKARIKRAEKKLNIGSEIKRKIIVILPPDIVDPEYPDLIDSSPPQEGTCVVMNGRTGTPDDIIWINWERTESGGTLYTIKNEMVKRCPIDCESKTCKGK